MSFRSADKALIDQVLSLERELNRYRAVFNNTGAGIIISEADMTISLANEEFARMSGYPRQTIEGEMKWTRVVAFPRDRDKMVRFHKARRKNPGEAPRNYEFTLIQKNGSHKHILARVGMIPGTDKSVGSFIDITPIVRAREEIRENESRLRGIVEAFEGFIYICGPDLRVSYVNKSLAAAIGRPELEFSCHKKLFDSDAPCAWCSLDAVFEGKTIKQEIQCPNTSRWYYAVSTPIYGPDHQVVQQQTILMDIHERKQAEIQIKARENLLYKENEKLRAALGKGSQFCGIVGQSRAMLEVYDLILRAAATDVNVIVYGESGTGKELVARAVHTMSDRCSGRFVPVHCGAIPLNLMESEFFGVKKGAFTGAHQDRSGLLDLADKGTLFMDELGEMDLSFQVKFLRVLEGAGYMLVGGRQVRAPDIRIVAATNQDLNRQVKTGKMRDDFFYRIHILPIYLPPLRERKEDIPLLITHFLKKHHAQSQGLPDHLMSVLLAHDWPGNVRELENTLQRYLNLDNLELLNTGAGQPVPLASARTGQHLKPALNRFEKAHIKNILDQYHWNRKATAKALGIGRKTLYSKMKLLGIIRIDIDPPGHFTP
ncbi:MAG: sigma 54-interacting transcriptional regulator [Desulfobacter sp.]|nr:MAG: sigma 54-interacting transcriptional regulator [Desulfobacter sp.]